MDLAAITNALVRDLRPLRFGRPVTHVYNPLLYARAAHDRYLELAGKAPREVVLVGMNPGPWGMAQTGVPFGAVQPVRNWLGVEAPVGKPSPEHPKRLVEGFGCRRLEVSGMRLWGWVEKVFRTPERFFRRFFVANYCPLLFLEESGRNRTPDRLPVGEQELLFAACDLALRRTIEHLEPVWVLGVGRFAGERARLALAGLPVRIGRITHPSPANPAANRGWEQVVAGELARLGIQVP